MVLSTFNVLKQFLIFLRQRQVDYNKLQKK